MYRITLLLAAIVAVVPAFAEGNKKVSILGDSYSTFYGAVEPEGNEVWYFPDDKPEKTDVTSPEQTWWRIFMERTGYELERNNSYSGSTVCNRGYKGDDYSRRSFINRMSDLGEPDLILIFGATNDYWAHVALSPEAAETPEPHPFYTFRPAMDYLLQQIGALYPEAESVFILNDEIQGPVRDIVIELCASRGVRCLQLSGIEKRMGHPDSAGMKAIAEQLVDFLGE